MDDFKLSYPWSKLFSIKDVSSFPMSATKHIWKSDSLKVCDIVVAIEENICKNLKGAEQTVLQKLENLSLVHLIELEIVEECVSWEVVFWRSLSASYQISKGRRIHKIWTFRVLMCPICVWCMWDDMNLCTPKIYSIKWIVRRTVNA